MNDTLIQVTGAVALAALVVREVFSYLKTSKTNQVHDDNISNNLVLRELQTMNSNHLSHIRAAIEKGTEQTIDVLTHHAQNEHNDSMKIVIALGELKGLLSNH